MVVVVVMIIDLKMVKVLIILMHLEAEGKFHYCLFQFIRSIRLGGKFCLKQDMVFVVAGC
jgi:hypothetical protein